MKTLVSTFLIVTVAFTLCFAQKDTLLIDKKGQIVLPEKGDFSIGIGANPFFRYLGNMFSLMGENQLNLSLFNNQLYGKYFVSPQNAIRIRLGVYQNSQQADYQVRADQNNTLFVTDKFDNAFRSLDITLGYEWRKGSNRMQISYGTEINLRYASLTETYSYGNKHSLTNQYPTSYLFGSSSSRPLKTNQNYGMGVGARIFTGIEYFFFSKISVGGEIGIGYIKRFNGKTIRKVERWDWNTNGLRIDDYSNNFTSSTTYTDILNGQIFILFHF